MSSSQLTTSERPEGDGEIVPLRESLVQRVMGVWHSLVDYAQSLPIIEFYKYLWSQNRSLLYFSLFVNYLFPILLEAAPWYFSRRLLASKLRDQRNSINHDLISGKSIQHGSLGIYTLLTLIYAAIHTLDQILKNRVQLAQKLVIKRLIVERILFSEIGSLERKFQQLFGTAAARPDQLEVRIFRDISDTLHLFNFTLPSLVRGIWTVALQGTELYKQRNDIDGLAIGRPALVMLVQEGLDYALDQVVDLRRTEALERMNMDMSQLVSTVCDGLVEIQINNMQQHQLRMMDEMSQKEMATSQGLTTFFERVYKTISNRSVLDFVSEVWVVQRVMERKGIDHERYRKIQNDIDYVFKLARRNVSLVRSCIRIVQTQSRVIELINLPSFADETVGVEQLPTSEQVFGRPAPTVEFGPGARYRYWNRVSRAERVAALQALRQRLRMPGMSLLQNLNSMSASVSRASTEPASRDEVDTPHMLTAQSDTEDGEKAGDVEPSESVADSKDDDSLCLLTEFRDLRVRSVAFAYEPDGPLALNIQPPIADVSDGPLWAEESPLPSDMHLVPGKVYGLVGQNRSGKSTLVQVLCRLFHPDPSTTRIVFNGRVPLHRVARASLREIISYVSQRPFIFPGTIAENIRMARPDATDWEVECAAEAAGCFIFEAPRPLNEASEPEPEPEAAAAAVVPLSVSTTTPPLKPWELQKRWWLRVWPVTVIAPHVQAWLSSSTAAAGASLRRLASTANLARLSSTVSTITETPRTARSQHRVSAKVETKADWESLWSRPLRRSGGPMAPLSPINSPTANAPALDFPESAAANSGENMLPSFTELVETINEEIEEDEPVPGTSSMHEVLKLPTAARGANLSGGFAQSVALARIFLRPKSKILILDESLGQMDAVKKRDFIMPRLLEFVRRHNMALIFITHDMSVLKELDHIFVLESGGLACQGSHRELVAQQAPAYMKLIE